MILKQPLPKKERAFATGIFNAGSNVGAILAPTIIPMIVSRDGTHWQYAFLTTGVFSALWLILWLKTYKRPEDHPNLSKAELAHINCDSVVETVTEKLPWRRVVPVRETWAFAVAKITDAAWWFYLFWAGKFLFDQFGLSIKSLALPLITIYVVADIGSVGGGWLSSAFIKRGWSVNRGRKVAMLICAVCVLPVVFAVTFHEAAHGFVAYQFGDDTAQRAGRVTFNPFKHVDPFGTIILPAMLILLRSPFLFGYAKPVPVNFRRLDRPRRDLFTKPRWQRDWWSPRR